LPVAFGIEEQRLRRDAGLPGQPGLHPGGASVFVSAPPLGVEDETGEVDVGVAVTVDHRDAVALEDLACLGRRGRRHDEQVGRRRPRGAAAAVAAATTGRLAAGPARACWTSCHAVAALACRRTASATGSDARPKRTRASPGPPPAPAPGASTATPGTSRRIRK